MKTNITKQEVDALEQSVKSRIFDLIDAKVWTIDATRVSAWLNSYTDVYQRYVALHVLDRLIYRSSAMTKSGFDSALQSMILPLYNEYFGANIDLSTWSRNIASHKRPLQGIFFCPVRLKGDSGASGDTVLRQINVNSNYTGVISHSHYSLPGVGDFKNPSLISRKLIVLVDDVLGSGQQIKKFSNETNLRSLASNNLVIYMPLIAMNKGVDFAASELSFLTVCPVEVLADDESFFTPSRNLFIGDSRITQEEVKQWYMNAIKAAGGYGKKSIFGHGDLSLTLAFQWGTPNQSLPLIWREDCDAEFSPLIKRRE